MKVSPAQREVSMVRKKRRKRMTADHQLRKQMMRARVTERKTMVRRKNGTPRQNRHRFGPAPASSSLKCRTEVRTEKKEMMMEASWMKARCCCSSLPKSLPNSWNKMIEG